MTFRPLNVLLDTAAWINAVKEPETLPAKALALLRNDANRFFLSGISLLEASTLERKRKVDFGMEFNQWLEKALAENLQVLAISARMLPSRTRCREHFVEIRQTASSGTAIAHQLTLLTPDWRTAFHRVCPIIRYEWPKPRKKR